MSKLAYHLLPTVIAKDILNTLDPGRNETYKHVKLGDNKSLSRLDDRVIVREGKETLVFFNNTSDSNDTVYKIVLDEEQNNMVKWVGVEVHRTPGLMSIIETKWERNFRIDNEQEALGDYKHMAKLLQSIPVMRYLDITITAEDGYIKIDGLGYGLELLGYCNKNDTDDNVVLFNISTPHNRVTTIRNCYHGDVPRGQVDVLYYNNTSIDEDDYDFYESLYYQIDRHFGCFINSASRGQSGVSEVKTLIYILNIILFMGTQENIDRLTTTLLYETIN